MARTAQERQCRVVERTPCRVSSSGRWVVVSLGYDDANEGCGQWLPDPLPELPRDQRDLRLGEPINKNQTNI
jgi:hypothetical protein